MIGFGRFEKYFVPGAMFDRVIVPRAVYEETRSRPATPDASAMRAAPRTGTPTHGSRTLTALLDTLLPKLVSGEHRAKDAGKFIGRFV